VSFLELVFGSSLQMGPFLLDLTVFGLVWFVALETLLGIGFCWCWLPLQENGSLPFELWNLSVMFLLEYFT
jgi:hypothetical protein